MELIDFYEKLACADCSQMNELKFVPISYITPVPSTLNAFALCPP